MRHLYPRVIMQGVGMDIILGTFQTHAIIKGCFTGIGIVFTPIRNQCVFSINQTATLKEIAEIELTVIIKTVTIKRGFLMMEHHMMAGAYHFIQSIIVGIVTVEGVLSFFNHKHMTKCFK